jgi:hypothetical protein
MTAPIKIIALDNESGPQRITCDEWILLEKYRRGSKLDGWSYSDKITLTLAFGKVNCYPGLSGRSGA